MKLLYKYFLVFSLLFFSCSKDTINTPVEEANKNYGSLNFTIDKTTTPSDVASIKVTLLRPGQPDIIESVNLIGTNSASINLKDVLEGNWLIKVDAFNSFNEIIYSGEANILVKANEIVYLTITLDPIIGQLGVINIVVKWEIPPALKLFDHGAVLHGGLPSQTYGVYQPNVLFDNGIYKMWYAGVNDNDKSIIFYATSPDSRNWKLSTSPALYPGVGTWDSYSIGHPKVIKVDSTYYMYYRGEATSYDNRHIGLAISTDGINWIKKEKPIIRGTFDEFTHIIVNSVLYINNKFYLYFSASKDLSGRLSNIYLATSLDGLNFDAAKMVLKPTQPWESLGINQVSVIWDKQKFKMIYNEFPHCIRIGYAESVDGINWVKSTEPIYIVTEVKNGWVTDLINLSFVKIKDEYKIYYAGNIPTAIFYKIGLLEVVR